MNRRALATLGLLCLALSPIVASGCELVFDLDGLGNGQCPSDQKACDNRCVSKNDPGTGCAATSCSPCVLSHATAKCGDDHLCAIDKCVPGYDDCAKSGLGCDTDLFHDPLHCNGCEAVACMTANGIAGCSAGSCATGGCNPGYDDCDSDPTTGCETAIWTDEQCAGCDLACATGTTCQQGICR